MTLPDRRVIRLGGRGPGPNATMRLHNYGFASRLINGGDIGLAEKIEIRLQDYRDERDRYDRIASIEMIEAVGEQFWPRYFAQLRDRLLPGGVAGIQAITIQGRLFQGYRREVDFIQRYVFPGGMLPSPAVLKSLGERFNLPVIGERIFGQDYAKTFATWRNNFRAAWPGLVPLGFDDRFRRLWEYYLAYCEAGFLSRNIDVRSSSQSSNKSLRSRLARFACKAGDPTLGSRCLMHPAGNCLT